MKEFILSAVSFALSSIAVFIAFVNDYNCKELKQKKQTQNYPEKWNHYRQSLMLQPSLKPVFEHVGYMKLTKHLGLIHEQLGEGGGKRGHICNESGDHCRSECARRHIYISHDGKPLFFCRNFYTVMLGSRLIDETKEDETMQNGGQNNGI